MPGRSGVAIFIHVSLGEDGEHNESSREGTQKCLCMLKPPKCLDLKDVPMQRWKAQVFRKQ